MSTERLQTIRRGEVWKDPYLEERVLKAVLSDLKKKKKKKNRADRHPFIPNLRG